MIKFMALVDFFFQNFFVFYPEERVGALILCRSERGNTVHLYVRFPFNDSNNVGHFIWGLLSGQLIHQMRVFMRRSEPESQKPFHGITILNLQEVAHSVSLSRY